MLSVPPYGPHPSAQSCALGNEAEAKMARDLPTGKARSVTTEDFNERVKRLLADKPDPRKAEPRNKNTSGNTPFRKG